MITPLFERLINHLELYQNKVTQEQALFGIGKVASRLFSRNTFEDDTCELVRDISREVQALDPSAEVNPEMAEKVRELFFEVIPKACSAETKEIVRQTLAENKALQNLLDPDVKKGRFAKEGDESLRLDPNSRLTRRMAKVMLANKLGYKGKLVGEGQGGAKFLTDVNLKNLGVFKTTLKHQSYWKNLHDGPLSYVMHNQAFYVSTEVDAPVQAEEVAYLVSSRMGFGDLVPPTQVMDLGGVVGSFQLFVKEAPGRKIAKFSNVAEEFKNKEEYSEGEIQTFQIFAVFDYLINNLDRHTRNWLVEYSQEGDLVEIHQIHAIDHDRAFAHTNPDSWRGLRNHYRWKNLKIAKEVMTPETKAFIRVNLTDDAMIEALTFESERLQGFMTDEKVKRIREKMHVLRMAAEQEGVTLEEIGNIRSAKEIMAFVGGVDPSHLK